jgi:hypothetical protein
MHHHRRRVFLPEEPNYDCVENNTDYCNGGNCKQCKGVAKPFPSDDAVNAMGAAAIAPFPLPAAVDTSK